VEKRPDELAADVFEAEFEMSVLIDGVVSTVKSCRTDIKALLVSNFVVGNEAWCVAGARSGDGGIERMQERIAEGHLGSAGFHQAGVGCPIKHTGLCGHFGRFYTESGKRTKKLEMNAKIRESKTKKAGFRPACTLPDGFHILRRTSVRGYFLAAAAGTLAYFFWKRSTLPAVSTSFCLPVKKGWQFEQISTRSISPLMVERV